MAELDPIFVKALKLLHSRSRDALDQLKQMTDEAIALRRGELALKKLEDEGRQDDKHGYKGNISRRELDRKRETEKRSLEKLKEDLSFLTDDQVPVKKPKLDASSDAKYKDSSKDRERSRDSSKESSQREKESHKPTLKEDPSWLDFGLSDTKTRKTAEPAEKRFIIGGNKAGSDSSEEDADSGSFPGLDAEQFATDMMDLACVVCKQIDMTSGNRLLDCQECHRLYHQECHRPPVSEDVDDPRFVWYCSKCSKNMKKMVKAQKPKCNQSSSSRERESTSSVPTKAFKPEPSTQTPFRRIDTGKSSGSLKDNSLQSSSSSSRPYTGLASLAANLSGKSHESKSSRGSESNNKQTTSSHSSKIDTSKGLGFLFKPDAHKITNISSQKSTSSEKGGLYKMSSGSSSGKSSSTGKSSSSSTKSTGISLLAKSSGGSSSKLASSSHAVARSNSNTASSSSSTSKNMSSSSLMSADKKLQMMKKKAAARAAEKKSFR